MMTIYDEMSRDELIDIIFDLEDEIETLQNKITKLKQDNSNKIQKDFEDNRKMVADIISSIVNNSNAKNKNINIKY